MTGVIDLNKPARISSAVAVARVKRLLPRGVKIGHAGTLDPFATGVLVVLIGKATRLSELFMGQPKQYQATVRLGATTPTLDPESAELPTPGATAPTLDRITLALAGMVGEVDQFPPQFSALKINGRRACDLVRRGHSVELKSRKVRIHGIELVSYDWPMVRLCIDCGRGTYIRSIARDLGEALGVAGYVTDLCRTRVGPCRIEHAVTIEQLTTQGIAPHLLDGAAMLGGPDLARLAADASQDRSG
jgi:tRNA pseudouridine55 synthase